MRIVGIILTIIGAIGTLVYGIQALGDTESFSVLGVDIAVSGANWTPVIISGVILIIGLVILSSSRKGSAA